MLTLAMSETTARVIEWAVVIFGSSLSLLVCWLVKRLLSYLESKSEFWRGRVDAERRTKIKDEIDDAVKIAVDSTMQTYVSEIRSSRGAEGKLTTEERTSALNKAKETALGILKEKGIGIGQMLLEALIEATVKEVKDREDS